MGIIFVKLPNAMPNLILAKMRNPGNWKMWRLPNFFQWVVYLVCTKKSFIQCVFQVKWIQKWCVVPAIETFSGLMRSFWKSFCEPEHGRYVRANHQWTEKNIVTQPDPSVCPLPYSLAFDLICSSSPFYCLSWEIDLENYSRSYPATELLLRRHAYLVLIIISWKKTTAFSMPPFPALWIGPC